MGDVGEGKERTFYAERIAKNQRGAMQKCTIFCWQQKVRDSEVCSSKEKEGRGENGRIHPIPRPVCCRLGFPDAEIEFGSMMFLNHQG